MLVIGSIKTNSTRPLLFLLVVIATPAMAQQTTTTQQKNSTPQTTQDLFQSVESILVAHCFDCHSGATPESNFQLDGKPKAFFSGGDYGEEVVVPGKLAESSLIKWITAKDPAERMPPEGDALSQTQIETLKKWISMGAPMPRSFKFGSSDLWSFQPIKRVAPLRHLLDTQSLTTVQNPVDRFVAQRLQKKQLDLSSRAPRTVLIRRLFLVSLGVPPSAQQVQEFLEDQRPDAYLRLVDRVLGSAEYGERWAQHWLDIVRFGETHGFETNRERPHAWHYRDYVIEALNADKPYDQFVKEQLAGDQLGAPTATGFIVAGPHDLVKSPDINLTLMQRQDELADIVNVAGTSFLGLTVGCARCHNHKFDPITQKDFYSMQAIFAGVNHADRRLPLTAEDSDQIKRLRQQIVKLETKLKKFVRGANSGLRPAVNAKHNVERFQTTPARYVRFSIERTNQSQPCIDELEIFSHGKNVALSSSGAKASSGGDFVHPLHKLAHINDGLYGNSKSWIAKDVKGWVQIELPKTLPINRIEWARDRSGGFGDRVAIDYKIEVATEPGQWKHVAGSGDRVPFAQGTQAPTTQYDFSDFSNAEAQQGRQWLAELTHLQQRIKKLSATQTVYAGTFTQPPATYRLYRGDPLQKREQVAPDTIEALGRLKLKLAEPEVNRRKEFADWLTRPDNPLLARVIVNRIWQHNFGRGIVATPNDFGNSGHPPSHPQLLDWLAAELIDSNWSLKHLQRLILTSHTFQQTGKPHRAGLAQDADCVFLWRFPPRRLEAEAIRDSILTVSGALDHQVGGKGFDGFEVELENVRHFFPKKSFGPADWRRMIYMTKVRQERDAVFGPFDCPDASQIIDRRSRSTTPLQSLNLLNSQFVLQQADFLAERLKREASSGNSSPVAVAYQLLYSRKALPDEVEMGEQFIAEFGLSAFCRAILNSNEFLFIQ